MNLMKEISFEEFKKMLEALVKESHGIELTEAEKKACEWFETPTKKHPTFHLSNYKPDFFGYYEMAVEHTREIQMAVNEHITKAIEERGYEDVIVQEVINIDGIDIKLNYRVENVD